MPSFFPRLLLILSALPAAFLFSCSSTPPTDDAPIARSPAADSPARFEYTRLLMGVEARIVLFAPSESAALAAADAAFARIAQLDAIMSDYRPDSELMRLAAQPPNTETPLSDDLFNVLNASLQLHRDTSGAFDITLGPLVALWRQSRASLTLPTPDALAAARVRTGMNHLRLVPHRRAARIDIPNLSLDLGGIAKGYAAHQAVLNLKSLNHPRCLVALAGDIALGDPPLGPDGAPLPGWTIALAPSPTFNPVLPREALTLANTCISTSGDAEQSVTIDSVSYSHIIDPRTGLGSTHRAAATVIAPLGHFADALATALCVLPPDDAAPLLRRYPPAAALLFELTPDGPRATIIDPSRVITPR